MSWQGSGLHDNPKIKETFDGRSGTVNFVSDQ
jgi:hypothetical protein